jgi:hypothetical protein
MALLGGGVVLLIVAVLVGLLALRGGGGGASGGGSITVESQPPGAAVSLNGEPTDAKTPTTLRHLAPGTYTVAVELADHDAQEAKVELKEDALQASVNATLKPAGTELVEVDILSRPAGAVVYMDGARIGQTPMRDFKVKAGTRRFRIVTEDFLPWTTLATVAPGKPHRVDARLQPKSGAPVSRGPEITHPGRGNFAKGAWPS